MAMDTERAKRRLAQRRATMDALRGRPLTAQEKLANLMEAMKRCDQCDNGIEPDWHYCAWCGWDLIGDEQIGDKT